MHPRVSLLSFCPHCPRPAPLSRVPQSHCLCAPQTFSFFSVRKPRRSPQILSTSPIIDSVRTLLYSRTESAQLVLFLQSGGTKCAAPSYVCGCALVSCVSTLQMSFVLLRALIGLHALARCELTICGILECLNSVHPAHGSYL